MNANSPSTAETDLDWAVGPGGAGLERPRGVNAQETRIKMDYKALSARGYFERQGFGTPFGFAHSTGARPNQSSPGVALAAQLAFACESHTRSAFGACAPLEGPSGRQRPSALALHASELFGAANKLDAPLVI